ELHRTVDQATARLRDLRVGTAPRHLAKLEKNSSVVRNPGHVVHRRPQTHSLEGAVFARRQIGPQKLLFAFVDQVPERFQVQGLQSVTQVRLVHRIAAPATDPEQKEQQSKTREA